MNIAIVGATGNVGSIEVLKKIFHYELYLIASSKSEGKN